MHPLVHELDDIKDNELENKISELTRKYFATANLGLKSQIIMVLETYKAELAKRQQAAYDKMMNSRNTDLDKLIKIN